MGAAVCIIVSLFCVDIPFVIVRLWTMIEFGLIVSDLIHPLKNIAMICFGLTQIYIIRTNRRTSKNAALREHKFNEERKLKSALEETWDLTKGDNVVARSNSSVDVVDMENDGDDVTVVVRKKSPADNKDIGLTEVQ